jgi:YVTN family beta-propeller protein
VARGLHRRAFLGTLASAAACSRRKVSYSGHVFVANYDGSAVAVVDLAAFAVVRHIALDDPPRLMIAHPAQPFVYAAAGDDLVQIDPVRLEVVKKLRLSAPATELAFSPNGDKIYTLTPAARGIVRLNAADLGGLTRITLASEPGRFAFTSDGNEAAATLPSKGAIALIDLAQHRVDATASTGGQPWTVRFRSDGRLLVAGDRSSRTAIMVDLAAPPQVAVRVPLGLDPLQLRENADGGQMFFAGPGSDSVVTLYPYRTEVGSTTLAGRAPGAIALSRQPEYLFVANPPTSTVTILNVATQRVMGVVDVGREPVHVSVTPDGEYALVLNRASGDMSVLHIPTLAGRRNKAAALFTQIPVGSGPVSAAVRLG